MTGVPSAWGDIDGESPQQRPGVHIDNRTRAKLEKPRMELVDLEFVADMAKQFSAGLTDGRKPNDWQKLDPAEWLDHYAGAVLRHTLAARLQRGAVDPDTGATEWAAVADNALICWWLERASVAVARR